MNVIKQSVRSAVLGKILCLTESDLRHLSRQQRSHFLCDAQNRVHGSRKEAGNHVAAQTKRPTSDNRVKWFDKLCKLRRVLVCSAQKCQRRVQFTMSCEKKAELNWFKFYLRNNSGGIFYFISRPLGGFTQSFWNDCLSVSNTQKRTDWVTVPNYVLTRMIIADTLAFITQTDT